MNDYRGSLSKRNVRSRENNGWKKKIQRFEGDPVHVSTEGFILATAFTFRCVHNYVEDLSCSRKMVYWKKLKS